MDISYLHQKYEQRKIEIQNRLQDFSGMKEKSGKELFAELAFCLLTPQSNGRRCWEAVERLRDSGLLFDGSAGQIKKIIKTYARFHNTKAKHIVVNRKFLNYFSMQGHLKAFSDAFAMREWLVKHVKGFGYKEASHFLRNIGCFDVAVLDRHIMKNLVRYGAIHGMPKSLTPKKYLEIEGQMKAFAEKVGIPFADLDLLFWSEETGEVFK